ncbi:hypothetical protein QYE76_065021 [Lolium multiflorum]|uniref:Ribonuclease H1 N-terminal domain-containing protein n=1 Tax=Lolium multiflorum TaxID=4521 RepID=A0AAD8S9A4_LOLMU|nr:hypothetical protein QYE76_065021 [Lolium multiflorum]
MLPLQDSILVLESILLKDKDPNYPVFTVRVPRDVGFVTDVPADIFFIAYEDIFKLFHARRLDYNLVRLFALNLAMKIKRESIPDVAIADPYYMRESQLNLSAVRVRASLYLQKCFLDNKRKDNILLAYFPEDTHCVLISIAPKFSLATYFDSGSAKKKNYARIRGVLDDALEGYFKKGGAFKEKAECFRDDGKHKFKHLFEFPCVKQPENSTLDAFYVMHHLKGFVRDSQNLRLPSALRGWAEKLARINDDDLEKTSRIPGSRYHISSLKTSPQGEGPCTRVERYARGTSSNASKRRVTRGQMPTYVVYKGRVPGVYEEWQDCLEQVHKFSGNSYKGYATREEAVAQWRAHVGKKKNRLKFLVPLLLTATAVVLYFTLV